LAEKKEILHKISYFHILTRPIEQKFDADLKTDLKQFHAISKGYDFCDRNFGGNDPTKF
jgi:hypothetical protein